MPKTIEFSWSLTVSFLAGTAPWGVPPLRSWAPGWLESVHETRSSRTPCSCARLQTSDGLHAMLWSCLLPAFYNGESELGQLDVFGRGCHSSFWIWMHLLVSIVREVTLFLISLDSLLDVIVWLEVRKRWLWCTTLFLHFLKLYLILFLWLLF